MEIIQQYGYIIAVLFILFLFRSQILSKIYGLETMTVQEAFIDFEKKPMDALFLDVRTPWEMERDPKIHHSKAIPLNELSNRMEEVKALAEQNSKIIVVCHAGHRSKIAGIKLKKAGYTNVFSMSGGMATWLRADYPTIPPKRIFQASG